MKYTDRNLNLAGCAAWKTVHSENLTTRVNHVHGYLNEYLTIVVIVHTPNKFSH